MSKTKVEGQVKMYVYKHTESNLWTVGFYGPSGEWNTESDHESCDSAAMRVHYLSGGGSGIDVEVIKYAIVECLPLLAEMNLATGSDNDDIQTSIRQILTGLYQLCLSTEKGEK